MEKNHKRSFMKSIAKSILPAQRGSKVKPIPPSQYSNKSTGFHSEQYFPNPSSMPKPKPKPSSAKPTGFYGSSGDVRGFSDNGGDENVDIKAASYISYVRERLKVEKVDSDYRTYQEMR